MMQLTKLALAVVLGAVLSFGQARAGLVEDGKAALARKDYNRAKAAFLKAAEQGDAEAQLQLGDLYSLVFKTAAEAKKDEAEAMKWYQMAAAQGNAPAMLRIGQMYRLGYQGPKNYAELSKWERKAAEQDYQKGYLSIEEIAAAEHGDIKSQYEVGLASYHKKDVKGVTDYVEAMKWFRKAAEQGHARAQYHLGEIYRLGQGVPVDYTEASKWYRKAAEQSDRTSLAILADMCKKGQGVSQDYAEAAWWYKKAADLGDYKSKRELSLLYDKGLGVPQDIKLSKQLANEAMVEQNIRIMSPPALDDWKKPNMGSVNMGGRAKPGDNKSLKVPAK